MQTNNNNINVFGIIFGIILLICGLFLMTDGLNSILNSSSTSANNKVKYDNSTDTYYYVIWED